jgi:hypothetical protein
MHNQAPITEDEDLAQLVQEEVALRRFLLNHPDPLASPEPGKLASNSTPRHAAGPLRAH